jgi:ribosomal protein S26
MNDNSFCHESRLARDPALLSELSQARIKEQADIPQILENNNYCISAIKKYYSHTPLARTKINEQLPNLET